jgi:hypothetical protein
VGRGNGSRRVAVPFLLARSLAFLRAASLNEQFRRATVSYPITSAECIWRLREFLTF